MQFFCDIHIQLLNTTKLYVLNCYIMKHDRGTEMVQNKPLGRTLTSFALSFVERIKFICSNLNVLDVVTKGTCD